MPNLKYFLSLKCLFMSKDMLIFVFTMTSRIMTSTHMVPNPMPINSNFHINILFYFLQIINLMIFLLFIAKNNTSISLSVKQVYYLGEDSHFLITINLLL